jgi:hypothetical protein
MRCQIINAPSGPQVVDCFPTNYKKDSFSVKPLCSVESAESNSALQQSGDYCS